MCEHRERLEFLVRSQDIKRRKLAYVLALLPVTTIRILVFATSSRNHVTSEEFVNVVGRSHTEVTHRVEVVIGVFSYLSAGKNSHMVIEVLCISS